MKYPEYLNSAKRHNQACIVLKDKIETFAENSFDDIECKHLVLSLYYLSGYIVECSLKFKIFEVIGYEINIDIDENIIKERFDIDFRKKIQTHNFGRLQNLLNSKISDVDYKSDVKEVNKLLNDWSPSVRYENKDIKYQEVKDLYKHTKKFMKKM